MKLGLFGGSFNPVHFGHVGIAKRAIEELKLDRLLVIPAATSPFKTSVTARPLVSSVEYLKAVFAFDERIAVDDRELKRGGVSYAIDTVREIAAENPGAEIFFIVGEDCAADLPRWKDYDELVKLCTFKVLPRTKESSTEIRGLFEQYGVVESEDAAIVKVVREGLLRKGGFCPCRLPKNPEFFCPCDEFKAQLRDDSFHGLCHCRLYRKP